MDSLSYNKIIDIADYDRVELKPHLKRLGLDDVATFGLDEALIIPDSKHWECAMMMRTFDDLGVSRKGALFAGIGAATEQITFTLASKGCVVFPTDRYLEVTPWSNVAPAAMMVRPQQFSQISFNVDDIIPVHSDLRSLRLPSGFFDGVYSPGAIERLGSLESIAAAAAEMGRILKPGGVACVSTKLRLEGPNDKRWFDEKCILFTPKLLDEFIVQPSGLELIDEPRLETSEKTFGSAPVLRDFANKERDYRSLRDKENSDPGLVLFHEGFLFCSVHIALRKRIEARGKSGVLRSSAFSAETEMQNRRVASTLSKQIDEWTAMTSSSDDSASRSQLVRDCNALKERIGELESQRGLAARVPDLEQELAAVRAESITHENMSKSLASQLPAWVHEVNRLRPLLAAREQEQGELRARIVALEAQLKAPRKRLLSRLFAFRGGAR